MDWFALVAGIVLFGWGLIVVFDGIRFRRNRREAMGRVLSAERKVSKSYSQGSHGHETHRHVYWKTKFEFEVEGRRYVDEWDVSGAHPGETVTVWYDRDNPHNARLFKSHLAFGWNLIATSLIPFGFWALDFFDVLP